MMNFKSKATTMKEKIIFIKIADIKIKNLSLYYFLYIILFFYILYYFFIYYIIFYILYYFKQK
jgi:hypothetical protein